MEEKEETRGRPRLPAGESVRIGCTIRLRRSTDGEIIDALENAENRSELYREALRFYFSHPDGYASEN